MTRYRLDRSTRRLGDHNGPGRVIVGGSPLVMLRLTSAGTRLVDRIEAGDDLSDIADTGSPSAGLLDRFLDSGICHPVPEPGDGPAGSDVAVVVPVFDRPAGLSRTLGAIVATAPDVAGVIVIDDGSVDAEAHRRAVDDARAAAPFPIERLRQASNRGPAHARNIGAAAAIPARVLAFVDAGCVPSPCWLDALLPHFADDRVALVAPRIVADRPAAAGGGTALARYEAARSSLDLGSGAAPIRPRSKVPYVPSTTFVVRADAFQSIGGFAPELWVGEDVDFVWRLVEAGQRLLYEPAAKVGHDHPAAIGAWVRRRFAYGTSAAPLARRHPGKASPLGVSGWSAGIWAAIALGQPGVGAALVVGTTADLARKLRSRGIDHPVREAVTLAGRGHLEAGRLIASASLRAWLPFTITAAVMSRRTRRAAAAAALIPPLVEWWRQRPDLDLARYVAFATLDDVAYGFGVWKGTAAERTLGAVIPTFTNWTA